MMKQVLKDTWNLLTFRIKQDRIESFSTHHLLFGLFCTWLVGMGRYWDDDRAGLAQKIGVGSVGYVFVLSFILFVLGRPFSQRVWSYRHVLTYVCLVSPPALLYAIPVEQFTNIETARQLNMIFLLVVAALRVALLLQFYRSYAGMRFGAAISSTFLPITGIIVFLVVANLQHVVFDIMGGLRDANKNNAHTVAYDVVIFLSCISVFAFPILLSGYFLALRNHRRSDDDENIDPAENW